MRATGPGHTPGRYAPVNGLSLSYEIHGAGAPLVLLHGGFGATGMFGPATVDRLVVVSTPHRRAASYPEVVAPGCVRAWPARAEGGQDVAAGASSGRDRPTAVTLRTSPTHAPRRLCALPRAAALDRPLPSG